MTPLCSDLSRLMQVSQSGHTAHSHGCLLNVACTTLTWRGVEIANRGFLPQANCEQASWRSEVANPDTSQIGLWGETLVVMSRMKLPGWPISSIAITHAWKVTVAMHCLSSRSETLRGAHYCAHVRWCLSGNLSPFLSHSTGPWATTENPKCVHPHTVVCMYGHTYIHTVLAPNDLTWYFRV